MKHIILLLSLLPFLASAEIYKTTDADGNTVYTDIPPNDDAQELDVKDLNISESPKRKYGLPNTLNESTPQTKQDPVNRYLRLDITSPSNEEAVRNNEGKVSVSVSLTPNLHSRYNDKLFIALDGAVVSDGKQLSVNLEAIDRGTHTLTAYIQDENQNILISAQPVTFNMFRFFKRN